MAKALQRGPEQDANNARCCQNKSQVRGNGNRPVLEVASRCSATDCSGNGSGLHRCDGGDGDRKSRRSQLSLDVGVISQSAAGTEVVRAFDDQTSDNKRRSVSSVEHSFNVSAQKLKCSTPILSSNCLTSLWPVMAVHNRAASRFERPWYTL